MCLLFYVIKAQLYDDPNQNTNQTNYKTDLMLAIPAIFDIIATSLCMIGLTTVAGSVFQMMKGFIVVITAFMALIFLGRKQYLHHWVSMSLIVMGIAIVGAVSIKGSESSDTTQMAKTSVQGVAIILVAQCFQAAMLVVEEKMLSGAQLDPLYIVGIEGLWGCIIFGIMLPIMQTINCEGEMCHDGKIENTLLAFKEMKSNPIIMY